MLIERKRSIKKKIRFKVVLALQSTQSSDGKISKIVLTRLKEKLVWTKVDLDQIVPTKYKKCIIMILQKNDWVNVNKSRGTFLRNFLLQKFSILIRSWSVRHFVFQQILYKFSE